MLPVISIGISIVIILVLLRFKVTIGLAMLAGAIISAIGGGLLGRPMLEVAGKTLSHPTTWELALTIAFVSALGKIMDKAGILALLIDSLQKLIRDTRYIMVAIPSLVGMLMVPGGAIMSAPMVEEVGSRQSMTPVKMAVANLMYRHLWYLIFPLFPSMILAAQLAGVNPLNIVLFNLPLAALAFLVTFLLLFKKGGRLNNEKFEGLNGSALKSFFKAIGPMLLAIILALVLGVYFPLAIFAGIMLVFVYLWRDEGYSLSRYFQLVVKSVNWPVFLAIFPIMYFKDVLEAGGGVEQVAIYFQDAGVPLPLLMVVVPFLGGFFTGSNTANIGISFPLFLPMFPEENYIIYVAFIYVSGIVGYLVSPIHLCLILTKEHFKCEIGNLYRYFLVPSGAIMTLGFILFLILR